MRRGFWIPLVAGLLPTVLSIGYAEYARRAALERGDTTVKHVRIEEPNVIDPLGSLTLYGGHTKASLALDDKPVESLRIAISELNNAGSAPILKQDLSEPLRVEVSAPWTILLIESPAYAHDRVTLTWHRAADGSFEAEPMLLNPGDTVHLAIYLSGPPTNAPSTSAVAEPKVSFHARIVNMSEFEPAPARLWDREQPLGEGPYVFLGGWAIFWVLTLAAINQTALMTLLRRYAFVSRRPTLGNAIFIVAMLLSMCVGEIMTTSFLRPVPSLIAPLMGSDWWVNWALLGLNAAAFTALALGQRFAARTP